MNSLILHPYESIGLLNGTITQIRRDIKPQPVYSEGMGKWVFYPKQHPYVYADLIVLNKYSPFQPQQKIYCRETWAHTKVLNLHFTDDNYGYVYKADGQPWEDIEYWSWHSPATMPREATRIFLEIEAVRVGRVQDITEEDAEKCGIMEFTKDGVGFKYGLDGWNWSYIKGSPFMGKNRKTAYEILYESIHGPGTYERNNWQWIFTVRRINKL